MLNDTREPNKYFDWIIDKLSIISCDIKDNNLKLNKEELLSSLADISQV